MLRSFSRFGISLNFHRWAEPIDNSIERMTEQPLTGEQRRSLRYFWLDGLFASGSEAFFVSFLGLFAASFGATNGQLGLLVSVGSLAGALALFPGTQLYESVGRRIPLILWMDGAMGRLMLLLLAFMPFFVSSPAQAIIGIIAFNGFRSFMHNLCNPAWTALVADLVPDNLRGSFFTSRNIAMSMAALLLTPLAGWLIERGSTLIKADYLDTLYLGPQFLGSQFLLSQYFGYQIAFFLAFVFGMFATVSFSHLVEPAGFTTSLAVYRYVGMLQLVRQNRAYLGFVLSAFLFNMSVYMAYPFFNVYTVNHLGGTETQVGFIAAIYSVTALAGQFLWGKQLQMRGALWVQVVSGFMIPLSPVLWPFYTHVEQVYVNEAFSGFLWAGYTMANFELLLSLTPDIHRARAVALYQTTVFASTVVGPLVGGWAADAFSYNWIFLASAFGRWAAMIIFVAMTGVVLYRKRQEERAMSW